MLAELSTNFSVCSIYMYAFRFVYSKVMFDVDSLNELSNQIMLQASVFVSHSQRRGI